MSSPQHMKIETYKDIKFEDQVATLTVMLNPDQYTETFQQKYNRGQAEGTTAVAHKFDMTPPKNYEFTFIVDGTGLVDSKRKDVPGEIKQFLDLGAFDGTTHRPYYCKLTWGTLVVKAVLTQATVTYKLFKTDGTPLRAEIKATFQTTKDEELRVSEEKKQSPDLTHVRVVQEGDTLPLMTKAIYGDISPYLAVAYVNGLTRFRKLEIGTELFFPPLAELERIWKDKG